METRTIPAPRRAWDHQKWHTCAPFLYRKLQYVFLNVEIIPTNYLSSPDLIPLRECKWGKKSTDASSRGTFIVGRFLCSFADHRSNCQRLFMFPHTTFKNTFKAKDRHIVMDIATITTSLVWRWVVLSNRRYDEGPIILNERREPIERIYGNG